MLLSAEIAHLIIVDVQEKLIPAIDGSDEVILHCSKLIKAAQRLEVPMIVTEQYPDGLGATITELIEPTNSQAKVFDKTSFSCYGEPTFKTHMTDMVSKDSSQIIVAGIEAHVCVLQTALDLKANGYDVFVVADAIGSRALYCKEIALERMSSAGITLLTTEMVIFEWLRGSDRPAFQDLRQLIM